jgi:hypothetical protein
MNNNILSEQEIDKIFQWLPYRDDWPIDRNQINDGINENYSGLINEFKISKDFNLCISQDGGMSNYLEFLCYPKGGLHYSGTGVLVYINLCAPIATYGQTECAISINLTSHNSLLAEDTGIIAVSELKIIENEILRIFSANGISLLEREFLGRKLPQEIIAKIDFLLGDQYLNGIFQMAD